MRTIKLQFDSLQEELDHYKKRTCLLDSHYIFTDEMNKAFPEIHGFQPKSLAESQQQLPDKK